MRLNNIFEKEIQLENLNSVQRNGHFYVKIHYVVY